MIECNICPRVRVKKDYSEAKRLVTKGLITRVT